MSAPPVPTPDAGPAGAPARETTTPGWWRRNRLALVALPLALAAALVASGDRLRTMWWENDLRRPTVVAAGESADFHQQVRDGLGGTTPLDVKARLVGVHDAATLPEYLVLPAGTRAVEVDLTLSADPDVVLVGCRLAVRDEAGTRYDYVAQGWGAFQPVSPCVPEATPGPWPSLGDLDDVLSDHDTPARPYSWSVSPVIVLPDDVEVADVLLWWQMPQHLRFEVPR